MQLDRVLLYIITFGYIALVWTFVPKPVGWQPAVRALVNVAVDFLVKDRFVHFTWTYVSGCSQARLTQ